MKYNPDELHGIWIIHAEPSKYVNGCTLIKYVKYNVITETWK